MKSKISCFNTSILKKDITRFLPLWVLYGIFLSMNTLGMAGRAPKDNLSSMEYFFFAAATTNFIYGFLCASTLFGDLFVSKMCNALHALPMRREGWFLTHITAGLFFNLVPNLIFTFLCYPLLREFWYVAWIWLLISTLLFLIFFGLAVFCCFCAGSRLGMAALYGILNFLAPLTNAVIEVLYLPLLPGVYSNWDVVAQFAPVLALSSHQYVDITFPTKGAAAVCEFIPEDWIYLVICTAAAVLLMLLALMLYRRRNLECAGDFLAFRAISPLFLLIATMVSGVMFFGFSEGALDSVSYLFLILGMAVGFFVASMLLNRTVKVFNKKKILTFVVAVVLTFTSFFITKLDPLGIHLRIPPVEQVKSCTVSMPYMSYIADEYSSADDIEAVRSLHRKLIEQIDDYKNYDGDTFSVRVVYELKNGLQIVRQYKLTADMPISKDVKLYMSRWQVVLNTNDFQDFTSRIVSMQADSWGHEMEMPNAWDIQVPPYRFEMLMDAIKADCDQGKMAQDWVFHKNDTGTVHITYLRDNTSDYTSNNTNYMELEIPDDADNTNAVLKVLAAEHFFSAPFE